MGIVRFALRFPHTFYVLAALILFLGVIAKKRGRRRIPMRPDLRRALERLAQSREPVGPIIRSYRGSHLKTNPVVN